MLGAIIGPVPVLFHLPPLVFTALGAVFVSKLDTKTGIIRF